MKNTTKRLLLLLLSVICVFAIAACSQSGGGNNGNDSSTSDPIVQPSKYQLNKTSVSLFVGETEQLELLTSPSVAVEYISGNASIASVSASGLVTAKGAGDTVIYVMVEGETLICSVKVQEAEIPAYSISLDREAYTLERGEKYTLVPTVKLGSDIVENAECEFVCLDQDIATVTSGGEITALTHGETQITVTYKNGDSLAAVTVKLTVIRNLKFVLSSEKLDLTLNSAAKTLTVAVFDEDVELTDATVVWRSDDEKVVTVDSQSGLVTPVGVGSTTVYAEVEGGRALCEVSVYTKYIASVSDFVSIYASEATLAGYYKLTNDIEFEGNSLDALIANAGGVSNRDSAVFTGLLDGDGRKIFGKENGIRLFYRSSGIIKNLVINGSYGVWGGAIADSMIGGSVQNVTLTATLRETRAFDNAVNWFERSIGGMFNYIKAGTIKNCVVNVTVPSNMQIIGNFKISDISAVGQIATDAGAYNIENCRATLKNAYDNSAIHLANGAGCDVTVSAMPVYKKELDVNGTYQLPASSSYTNSDSSIVSVSDSGLVTALKGGTATVLTDSAEYVFSVCQTVSSLSEFVAIYANEASLAGSYKLTADITMSGSLDSLIAAIGGINNINNAVFTGSLDGNGHSITGPGDDARLFLTVAGTVKNLTVNGYYGVWGGALGEMLSSGGYIENVTVNATLRETRAFDNGTSWYARNVGAMFNYISGGTVKDCTVNVTIIDSLTLVDGFALTDMSAIGQIAVGASAYSITGCTATLVNNYDSSGIYIAKGTDLGTVSPN